MQLIQKTEECNSIKTTDTSTNFDNLNYEVIIPCLNGEETIERSIVSTFSQSRPPRRVIVHDNKSADASVKIVKSLTKKYKNLLIVEHGERVSAMFSYKRSLENAVGRVLFLAADDVLAPDAVARLIQFTDCHNTYHSIVPQQTFFDEDVIIKGANFADIWRAKNATSCFLINPADNPFIYGLHDAQSLINCFPEREFYGWDLWVSYNLLKSVRVHFMQNGITYVRGFSKASKYYRSNTNKLEMLFPLMELSKELWKCNKGDSRILLIERLVFMNLHESLSLNGSKLDDTLIRLLRKLLEVRVWNSSYRKRLFEGQTSFNSDEIKSILDVTDKYF